MSGSNFIVGAKGSRVLLDGTPVETALVSPTQLRVMLPAGVAGSTVTVAVQTPTVDGGTSAERQLVRCYQVLAPAVRG